MEAEIREIIEQSLPKQVGETLQQRLKEGEYAEQKVDTLEDALAALEVENSELQIKVADLLEIASTEEAYTDRLADLEQRERDLEVAILSERLKTVNDCFEEVAGFVSNLTRNTEFRRQVNWSNNSDQRYDDRGNASYYSYKTGEDVKEVIE